jgi:hypothetical protein
MIDDKNMAIRMGEAGARDAAKMTWSAAIQKLLL